MKLLIATHNTAKLEELMKGASPLTRRGIQLVSLDDMRIHEDPAETGTTFEENAILKAKFYASRSGLPTVADDGGLTVDILNGEPGVHSRRWLGYDAKDSELISYTLERLKGIPDGQRTAALQTTLCYYNPANSFLHTETGKIEGSIAHHPSGHPSPGYPYRALFVVSSYGKYYDDLTAAEHRKINHRLKAIARLVIKIKSDLVE